MDGNKPAAFLSIGIFLTINGYKLVAEQIDAIQTIFVVAGGEFDERGLAARIANNSVPIPK